MVSLYHTYFTSFFQDCKAVKCGVLSSQCVKNALSGRTLFACSLSPCMLFPGKAAASSGWWAHNVRTYGLHRIFWHAKFWHAVPSCLRCSHRQSVNGGFACLQVQVCDCTVWSDKPAFLAVTDNFADQFSTVLRLDINAVCHVAAPFSGRLKVALLFIVPSFGAAYKGRQCKISPMLRTENSAVAPKLYPCAANW